MKKDISEWANINHGPNKETVYVLVYYGLKPLSKKIIGIQMLMTKL
jgi:hypothetical protein